MRISLYIDYLSYFEQNKRNKTFAPLSQRTMHNTAPIAFL